MAAPLAVDLASRALAYLRATQDPHGAWGYREGGMGFADATALAALALGPSSDTAARAGTFMATLRRGGGTASCPPDPDGSWMTAHALLLAARAGPAEGARDAVAYLLETAIARDRPGHVAPGWPWVPHTAAWVEPTAWTVLALASSGGRSYARVGDAVAMLLGNVSRGGGWSLYEGRPFPYHTGLVLLSLEAAGATATGAIARALSFLEAPAPPHLSALDAAFRLWALARRRSRWVAPAQADLVRLGTPSGRIGTGPFETACALVALAAVTGQDPILGPVGPGVGR